MLNEQSIDYCCKTVDEEKGRYNDPNETKRSKHSAVL